MVQARGSMRLKACAKLLRKCLRVPGALAGDGGGTADGDMVGMSIGTSIVKRKHDIRLELADDVHDMGNQRLQRQGTQLAVTIVQAAHVLDTELVCGAVQFLFATSAQGTASCDVRVTDLSRFATGK